MSGLNITQLSNRIKKLPHDKVKVKELPNGRVDIMVCEDAAWVTAASDISKKTCEDVLGYSPNRLILG